MALPARPPNARPYHCGACGAEGHPSRTCLTLDRVARPLARRRKRILGLIAGGFTLAEIGAAVGISGERVRQLIARDEGLTKFYRLARRIAEDHAMSRRNAKTEALAEREEARKARRDTIAAMLAAGCSFVEIGAALGTHYKGPAYTTRRDPELQAIYEAATELRKARTREKMSTAHTRA